MSLSNDPLLRALPLIEQRSKVCVAKDQTGIWQRRFCGHTILKETDYARHVDDVPWNPLKHGWVQQVTDWPYFSFHHYVRLGVLPDN